MALRKRKLSLLGELTELSLPHTHLSPVFERHPCTAAIHQTKAKAQTSLLPFSDHGRCRPRFQ